MYENGVRGSDPCPHQIFPTDKTIPLYLLILIRIVRQRTQERRKRQTVKSLHITIYIHKRLIINILKYKINIIKKRPTKIC